MLDGYATSHDELSTVVDGTTIQGVITWGVNSEEEQLSFGKELVTGFCPLSVDKQMCGSCPFDIVTNAAHVILHLWNEEFVANLSASTTFTEIFHTIDANYLEPYTVASCATSTINGTDDQVPLEFALIAETKSSEIRRQTMVSIPEAKNVYYNVGNISEYRLDWVNLPAEDFDEGMIGAVLLYPRPNSESVQEVTTCTLGAGWGSSALQTAITNPDIFFSSIVNVPFDLYTVDEIQTTESLPDFTNRSYLYPHQRISISKDWAQHLNPLLALPSQSNTSLIHAYMSTSATPYDDIEIAMIFNILLASGLSRIGPAVNFTGKQTPSEGYYQLK